MTSLTTRRIYSKVRALDKRCCDTYDMAVGARSPTDKFWMLVDQADEELGKKLQAENITALEISAACESYHKEFQALCARVKK